MWRIEKWSFHSAVAKQPLFPQAVLGLDSVSTLRQTALYQSTFEIYLFNCRSEFFFLKGGIELMCWFPQGSSWQQEECCFQVLKFFCTMSFVYLCDVVLYIHILSGEGQVSLSYVFAVRRTVDNRLLIWVSQAIVNHKKIQHQIQRKNLQEAVLVKDACDICFHMYFNELLLVQVN